MIRFDPPSLHQALAAEREARGLTWAQVAEQCGVAASTIARLKGSGRFELDGMLALTTWLGRPVEEFTREVLDPGPFYHGTKAALTAGDLLSAGFPSNYRPEVVMNHIYFTALRDGAGLAAEIAPAEGFPRVYLVEPTGPYENDPNVTNRRFPGNPTRSYRSREPLRILGEVTDWKRLSPEALQLWRDRLAAIRADPDAVIIN